MVQCSLTEVVLITKLSARRLAVVSASSQHSGSDVEKLIHTTQMAQVLINILPPLQFPIDL